MRRTGWLGVLLAVVTIAAATAAFAAFNPGARLAPPQRGADALHWAALQNQVDSIDALLDRGVDVAARDMLGRTPLMAAAAFGSTEAATVLIARGAEVGARDTEEGDTALHYAAQYSQLDTIRILAARGADLRLADETGATPLRYALNKSNKGHAAYDLLVSLGAAR